MREDAGERIERFEGEIRMLVIALGALFGFQLQAGFAPAFLDLPTNVRMVHLAALSCNAIAFLALLVPAAFHRIASEIEREEEFLAVVRRCETVGFSFLILSLALSFFVQATRSLNWRWGVGAGIAAALVLWGGWFLIPHRVARRMDAVRAEEVKPSRGE